MSASWNWIAWNVAIGLPNCCRSRRVGGGEVVGALREADAHRRDRDAAAVEDLQELPEALRRAGRAGSPRAPRSRWNESSRVSEARQPSFCIGGEIS